MNKTRPKQLSFRVSEEEYQQLQEKICAVPMLPCGLQQRQRPHHVGPRESERIADRAVDVAFGREMDHPVYVVLREEAAHGIVPFRSARLWLPFPHRP